MAVPPANVNLPLPTALPLNPDGTFTHAWWYYFQRMFARTGGGTGGDFGPAAAIELGASPFRFVAPSSGSVLVSGGGITLLRYSIDGTKWFSTGSYYGAFPVAATALLEVTYVRTPIMTFFPG